MSLKKVALLSILLLSGCGGSDGSGGSGGSGGDQGSSDDIDHPEYKWTKSSGSKYLSENGISYKVNSFISPVDVVLSNIVSHIETNENGKKVYGFDDIDLNELSSSEYEIVNNTPDRIDYLVVNINEYEYPVKLLLDKTLPPFSSAKILFNENVSGVLLYNTSEMFLPTITLAGDGVSSDEGLLCTSTCYSDPNKQQGGVYEIISSNMHKAMNHKALLPELTRFYIENNSYGCPSGKLPNCDESVARINYMKMSAKGHRLSLKSLSGPYTNEGVGGGGSPKLNDIKTNSGGWASIWANYITEGMANYRPFDGKTQKTLFHESAHGYGYNHDSGMTYGFADYYGLEFLSKYFEKEDIEGTSEFKASSIIPVLVESNDNHLKYKLLKLDEGQDTTSVNSRVMTEEKISRSDRFFIDNDSLYYEVIFDEAPTSAVVIQFFDNSSERVFTTREIANFYRPEAVPVDDIEFEMFELPKKVLSERDYIHVNAVCTKYLTGSRGAERKHYEALWNSDDFTPELLHAKYYVSSNMSQTNERWRIDMQSKGSLSMTSEDRYTHFSEDDSLLCVR